MKLYHGTDSFYLDGILRRGLIPRGDGPGNYAEMPSNPNAVYLTNAYPLHFCNACLKESDVKIVVEVDADKLDPVMMAPDEDFLAQQSKIENAIFDSDASLAKRTEYFRERAHDEFSDFWGSSLEFMGTCAYYSTISRGSLTRVALIPVNCGIWFASDPTITIQNYRIMGWYYRNLTKWIFGDTDFEEDPLGRFDRGMVSRDGITVIDAKE